MYLLFFDEIDNVILSIVSSGFFLDIFASNFGGYFFGFLATFLVLNYIYRNILSSDRFIAYLSLNALGILVFNFSFYLISTVTRNISKMYFFDFSFAARHFLSEFIFTILASSLFYLVVNLISPKTRDRLIIIGS